MCVCVRTGAEGPGVCEERELNTEPSGTAVIYNPHSALSVEKQRQKLPVFKVSLKNLHETKPLTRNDTVFRGPSTV